jgi:hypothetical protein
MTTKFLRLCTAALLLTSTPLLRAAIAPAENLLPADTLAFFTVPDTAAFRAACKTSPQMLCWNDPAMKPFHDKFMAKFNEKFVTPVEKDLGVKVADFLDLPQGQFTVAVTVNGSNGHDDVPPGLLLLVDTKGRSDSLKTNLAALTKKWTDAGRALRTEKIHGLAFTVVPLNSNDFSGIFPKRAPVQELGKETKPDRPGEIYFTQFESLLVAGNSPLAVEGVAAHLTGGSTPALADDATFAADQLAQFRDAPVYYGWFNARLLFSQLLTAPDEDSDSATPSAFPKFNIKTLIAPTGLDRLKSASFAIHETRDGSAMTLHLTVPEAGRTGLIKILALPPKDAGIPAFVPADAVKFTRIRLDGKQTWAELQKMVAAFSPQGMAGLDSAINLANSFAQQKDPGFDLRTALFGNLGDDLISYQKPATGDSLAALSSPPTLYLVGVANPDQVIAAAKILAAMGTPQDAQTAPREFLGRKIQTIALRNGMDPATGTVRTSPLYLSASGGYVALSTTAAVIEEYLRSTENQAQPLHENAALTDAVQRLGGAGGGLFGFENQRETMRVTFKAFKNPAAASSVTKLFPPAFRDWADFSLLPDYGQVQKYFYLSVFDGKADDAGLTLKMFSPRPPALN